MQLLLARHGNTFAPGEKSYWVGARNDLALVDEGRAQARRLAVALQEQALVPAAVYCGSLRRTRDYARIVTDVLGLPEPAFEPRLDEVDYGAWSGLTNDEIAERFGTQELEAWRVESRWPSGAEWPQTEEQVVAECQGAAAHLHAAHAEQTVLVVSSNGRLRYFLTLVAGELERRRAAGTFAMRTGNLSKLVHRAGAWELAYWNVDPAAAETHP